MVTTSGASLALSLVNITNTSKESTRRRKGCTRVLQRWFSDEYEQEDNRTGNRTLSRIVTPAGRPEFQNVRGILLPHNGYPIHHNSCSYYRAPMEYMWYGNTRDGFVEDMLNLYRCQKTSQVCLLWLDDNGLFIPNQRFPKDFQQMLLVEDGVPEHVVGVR